MSEYPTATDGQIERATKELDLSKAPCPEELQGGRIHDTYPYLKLDAATNLHYCKTCGKSFESKRRK